jgi:hypothetical protein
MGARVDLGGCAAGQPELPSVAPTANRGYAGPAYPASLAHVGTPLPLPGSGGWCLLRTIGDDGDVDASAPYPFLVCHDWSRLADDLATLTATRAPRPIVSVTAVTDPFAEVDPATLARAFPDLCREYKAHYIIDLAAGPPPLDGHHRRNVRQGLRDTTVELTEPGGAWFEDWIRLYGHLVARHAITGPADFPASALRQQLEIPGMLAARAIHDGRVVGMTLWAIHEDRAYYHLGAYDETGYRVRAAYAMFAEVLSVLAARGIRRVGLGAGAGAHAASAGLERFKRGWATHTAPVMLGGRILDHTAYTQLCHARAADPAPYFPAYRAA